MLATSSSNVLEFNCRLGDPETQPILLRMRSDLASLCQSAAQGKLSNISVEWDPRAALGVVMASGGYPGRYEKGKVIHGLSQIDNQDTKVFHAGTAIGADESIITSGGRVLCVTSLGKSVSIAQQRAYAMVKKIHWHDTYYRTDIGYRAVARERHKL